MHLTLEDAKVFGAVLLLVLHELGELNLHVFKVPLKHFTCLLLSFALSARRLCIVCEVLKVVFVFRD